MRLSGADHENPDHRRARTGGDFHPPENARRRPTGARFQRSPQHRRRISHPHRHPPIADPVGMDHGTKEAVLREADVVSVHAALAPETKGMVAAAEFAQMKRGAILVNCARGEIVQEAALADALRSGKLSGAAVDVFDTEPPVGSPLLAAPNVVFTPHLGASTREAQARAGLIIAEQVLKVLDGRRPEFLVNPGVYG